MTYKIASPTGSCLVTVFRWNVRLRCGYTDTQCTALCNCCKKACHVICYYSSMSIIFTALHTMQGGIIDEKNVCSSVSPSVSLSNAW